MIQATGCGCRGAASPPLHIGFNKKNTFYDKRSDEKDTQYIAVCVQSGSQHGKPHSNIYSANLCSLLNCHVLAPETEGLVAPLVLIY